MVIDHRIHMLQLLLPLDEDVRYYVLSDAGLDQCGLGELREAQLLYPRKGIAEDFAPDPNEECMNIAGIFDFFPRSIHRIQGIVSALKPGDIAFTVARRFAGSIGLSRIPSYQTSRDILSAAALMSFEEYCLAPGLQDLRWIFPYDRKIARSITEMYQPSTSRGRYRKIIYTLFASLNMHDAWTPYRIFVAEVPGRSKPRKTLRSLIAGLMENSTIQLCLFTGTPSHYHKVTLQVISNSGRILAYAKTAVTEQAVEMLSNEARALDALEACSFEYLLVPHRIWFGKLGRTSTLVQSNHPDSQSGPLEITELHVKALSELLIKNSQQMKVREGWFFRALNDRINWVRLRVDQETGDLLAGCLELVSSKIGVLEVLHGICHRDFTPWNTKLVGRRLYVFDWEWSLPQAPPFMDLFHFMITCYTVVRQYKADDMLSSLKKDFSFLMRYAYDVGFDRIELWPYFVVLYLLDFLTFYLKADILQGDKDSFANHLFTIRFQLLKLLQRELTENIK